uniref:uncharacterized protein LOC117607128 n=1 Tax=Osmia lignaria TaxID=473952 RepID=UPI0014784651|nr:uncharacterized protein LOC117607128 [Osmia lignaria]
MILHKSLITWLPDIFLVRSIDAVGEYPIAKVDYLLRINLQMLWTAGLFPFAEAFIVLEGKGVLYVWLSGSMSRHVPENPRTTFKIHNVTTVKCANFFPHLFPLKNRTGL